MNQLRDNLKTLGLSPNHIFQQVKDAISEDLAGGEDITSISTISETQVSTAEFTSRSAGVVSGLHVVAAVLEYCGINHYEVLVDEGSKVTAGKVLIRAQGNTQKLLLAERTALNFLSHLSGISTLVNTWVEDSPQGPPRLHRCTPRRPASLRATEPSGNEAGRRLFDIPIRNSRRRPEGSAVQRRHPRTVDH